MVHANLWRSLLGRRGESRVLRTKVQLLRANLESFVGVGVTLVQPDEHPGYPCRHLARDAQHNLVPAAVAGEVPAPERAEPTSTFVGMVHPHPWGLEVVPRPHNGRDPKSPVTQSHRVLPPLMCRQFAHLR